MQSKNSDPKLLKPVFELLQDGKVAVKTLVSVDIKRTKGAPENYFAIENDLVISQPYFFGTTHWVIGQSIVPIVELSEDRESVRCLGTGFYIHTNGLLMTAAHAVSSYMLEAKQAVTLDIDKLIAEEGSSRVGVFIRHNRLFGDSVFEFLPLRWAHIVANRDQSELPWMKPKIQLITDVAICQTFGSNRCPIHQPLSIIQPGIKGYGWTEGRQVLAVGYAEMLDFSVGSGATENLMRFVPHASVGKVVQRVPDNNASRTFPSPGPCFEVASPIASGMSGSPIFDEEGVYVCGIASSSWQGENQSLQDKSYCSMIRPMCDVPLAALGGKTIYQVLNQNPGGMTKIFAPNDM